MHPFTLKPGEKMPEEKLQQLKKANEEYSYSKDFSKYLKDLREIFHIEKVQETTESKLFLAGFLEGEASLSISAKKLSTAKFGLLVDPEFNVTQHVNGFSVLYLALEIFKTGRIRHKQGSNATLVLTIDNRRSLEEKVIPFYENYVVVFSSYEKKERLSNFKYLLKLFNDGAHLDLERLVNEILPIWDKMRKQKGQSNEVFENLETAQLYARNFKKKQ